MNNGDESYLDSLLNSFNNELVEEKSKKNPRSEGDRKRSDNALTFARQETEDSEEKKSSGGRTLINNPSDDFELEGFDDDFDIDPDISLDDFELEGFDDDEDTSGLSDINFDEVPVPSEDEVPVAEPAVAEEVSVPEVPVAESEVPAGDDLFFGGDMPSPDEIHEIDEVPDMRELAAEEIGAGEIGADEISADEIGAVDIPAVDEVGAGEIGADEIGADEIGAVDIPAVDEIGSGEIGADEIGLDDLPVADEIPVTDELALDDIGSEGLSMDDLGLGEINLGEDGEIPVADDLPTADEISLDGLGEGEIGADEIGAGEIGEIGGIDEIGAGEIGDFGEIGGEGEIGVGEIGEIGGADEIGAGEIGEIGDLDLSGVGELDPFSGELGAIDDSEEDTGKKKKKGKKGKKAKEGEEGKKFSLAGLFHKLFDNVPDKKKEGEELLPDDAPKEEKPKKEKKPKMTPEEKKALEAEKAEAKKEKEAKKAEAKAAKEAAKAKKKEAAILEAEEAAKSAGHINKYGALIVIAFFALIGVVIILGSSTTSYNLNIKGAAKEFGLRHYNEAYYRIRGLEIKPEDMELHDKIMTVMYVNKQLNSYNSYAAMDMHPEAIDSLLKGLQRYEKYLALATELGIESDLDYVRGQILAVLERTYGVSERDALHLVELEDQTEYSRKLYLIAGEVKKEEEVEYVP